MFAVMVCPCKYEIGYKVSTLHFTENDANLVAADVIVEKRHWLDGIQVVKFNPNTVDFTKPETYTVTNYAME